ncbi:hypothetical protein GGR54DRAFT_328969 [Hypoxylon sp. NC1633]|nr:hypothetical protein GGR54DRAFT_328969 [Hypoxylon sp. NC1633]
MTPRYEKKAMNPESEQATLYGPLYSDASSMVSLGSTHEYKPKRGFFRRFRTPSRDWVSGHAVVATALVFINALLLSAVLIAVTSHQSTKCECTDTQCAAQTSFFSPLLEPDAGVIEYEVVMFGGALEYESVYKGTPNPELDEAWTKLTHLNNSGVGGEVIDRIGKSRIAVKYSEEEGGMYDVGIEVFHHLHCLNLLRKYTYRSYYDRPENRPTEFTDSEPVLRAHVDHCVDMLRQAIMCQGDVGIVTYNWVEGWSEAYPDFSTQHKCRKFDRIVEWADRYATPVQDPIIGPDSVILPRPPS